MNGDKYGMVPFTYRAELREYIERGTRPGQVLTAVLDDRHSDVVELLLSEQVKAHGDIWRELIGLHLWIKEHAPVGCYGGAHKVESWLRKGGLQGPVDQVSEWTYWPAPKGESPELSKLFADPLPAVNKAMIRARLEAMNEVANGRVDIDLGKLATERAVSLAIAQADAAADKANAHAFACLGGMVRGEVAP